MNKNQRITDLFTKNKNNGKSINIQDSFQTPKFNRYQVSQQSGRKQASSSKYQNIKSQRIQSTNSQTLNREKNNPREVSILYHEYEETKKRIKSKEEDLRQTDDSVKPSHKKKLTINNFKIIKQLGKGKHGTVFLAVHIQSGFIGALKVFTKKQLNPSNQIQRQKLHEELIREFKIQSFVNHTHIIKIYSIFADKNFIYAFMELGSDGQLFQIVQKHKKFKQETISFLNKSLLEALSHLHSEGIIHRDIKPQNVVLIHGFPKICDFGQSNFFSKQNGQLRETLCGTPLYLSPQVLMGEKYDEKIDIWALGAMGYELFTGCNPFDIKNKDELKRIITHEFKMIEGSIQICNFITHCLKKHPKQRPTASKLLKHPFILKWKQLETAQQLCPNPQK